MRTLAASLFKTRGSLDKNKPRDFSDLQLRLMRALISIISIILFFTSVSTAQELKEVKAIKLNTKFLIRLTATNSSEFSYEIISTTPFNEAIQSSSINSYLDDSLGTNEVQGILTTGYFGSYKTILMVIKSGLEAPLDYDLFIDEKGNNKFKKTSTVTIHSAYPTLEVWQEYIHSAKVSGFRKAKIESVETEIKLDTTCNNNLDIGKGNNLLGEQLKCVFDLINSEDKAEIERIKEYEKTINSTSESNWGWKNELLVNRDGRYFDGYIDSKKVDQPLVYKVTECPYMKRETGYFFTKRKKDVKLVVFVWKLRWVGGWQSRAYNSIAGDFRLKHEFIIKSLSSRIGNPIETNETSKNIINSWRTKDGVEIKSNLFIDKDSFSLKLYVYTKSK